MCREQQARYGTTVIIDTVHGANTAKIKSYRMNENPYYSVLSKVPTYRIRQVLNYLQLEEYLFVTSDDYAVVKLGVKAKEIDNKQIIMKLAKESSRETKEVKSKSKKSKAAILGKEQFTKNEESLFEKLRVLRTEIAREEKVPPYIVFSDKTLTHMCIVKPKSKQEMLKVSGVGEFKFEKYGGEVFGVYSIHLRVNFALLIPSLALIGGRNCCKSQKIILYIPLDFL